MNAQFALSKTQTSKEEINAIHDEFRRCGKNAREWMRQCQMMLPKIRDEEVWKKKGYDSIYDYARILAGMSKNSVDDALWIMDKIANKPELQEIAKEKGLSAVRPVVAIATEKTSQFWAEKASDMSQNTLKTYVRNSRDRVNPSQKCKALCLPCTIKRRSQPNGQSQDGGMSNGDEGNQSREVKTASIYMKLEVEVIEKLKQIKGDRDWNELMKDLLNGKGEMYMTENGTVPVEAGKQPSGVVEEKPAPVNTGKRYIPREIQKYVTKKTSGLCAYPGCAKPYEILHHTKRFALDQTHDPDTIRPLCKAHERLAHHGLIGNEGRQPVEFMTDEGGGLSEVGKVGEESCGTINWSLLAEPNTNNPKYAIDKKVNEYYMPKLE